MGDEKIVISKGHGSWLSHLIIDDEVVWRIEDPVPQWVSYQKPLKSGDLRLESDSQNRADFPYIFNKRMDEAEVKKVYLEEMQRHDKKLRIAANEKREQEQNPYLNEDLQ